jgi:hypothetical protein
LGEISRDPAVLSQKTWWCRSDRETITASKGGRRLVEREIDRSAAQSAEVGLEEVAHAAAGLAVTESLRVERIIAQLRSALGRRGYSGSGKIGYDPI